MIHCLQGGRCGNQLFNYSFVKVLSKIYKDDKCIFNYAYIRKRDEENFWEDSLVQFKLSDNYYSINDKNFIKKNASIIQKIALFRFKLFQKIIRKKSYEKRKIKNERMFYKLSKYGIYYLPFGYSKFQTTKQKNKFVYGAFEDFRWFDMYRNELIEEFQKKDINPCINFELINRIQTTNSVCISLRRWDNPVYESKYSRRNVCNLHYYTEAITYVLSKIQNPVFFIFSDDIVWAKEYININFPSIKTFYETGRDDVSEKLRIMSMCKHFILSNSTFPWWAQYLSESNDKIVVSPETWIIDNEKVASINMPGWHLIPYKK